MRRPGLRYLMVEGDDVNASPLVMLHGMFGGLSNFDRLISLLKQEKRTIIVPEIPLYDTNNRSLTVQRLSEWVFDNIIYGLGLDDIILLGNSLGGHIALECALKEPRKIKGLVLTGSSGLFESNFGCSRPRRFDRDYIRERASMTFYEDDVEDSTIDEIQQILRNRLKLMKLLKIARSAHDYNMEAFLGDIRQPCLLVWGRNDVITPPEVARSFFRSLPNSKLVWIDKCGHAPMMEKPNEFAVCLSDFLDDIEPIKMNYSTTERGNIVYDGERSYLHQKCT